MSENKQEKPPRDLGDLMLRLAQIRQEVERQYPEPKASAKLLKLLALLVVLVLLPLLLAGPCALVERGVHGVDEAAGGAAGKVMPRPAR